MSINKETKAPTNGLCEACEEAPLHIDELCNYCYYDRPTSDEEEPPPPKATEKKKKKGGY